MAGVAGTCVDDALRQRHARNPAYGVGRLAECRLAVVEQASPQERVQHVLRVGHRRRGLERPSALCIAAPPELAPNSTRRLLGVSGDIHGAKRDVSSCVWDDGTTHSSLEVVAVARRVWAGTRGTLNR